MNVQQRATPAYALDPGFRRGDGFGWSRGGVACAPPGPLALRSRLVKGRSRVGVERARQRSARFALAAREGAGETGTTDWIPAFAGMTERGEMTERRGMTERVGFFRNALLLGQPLPKVLLHQQGRPHDAGVFTQRGQLDAHLFRNQNTG